MTCFIVKYILRNVHFLEKHKFGFSFSQFSLCEKQIFLFLKEQLYKEMMQICMKFMCSIEFKENVDSRWCWFLLSHVVKLRILLLFTKRFVVWTGRRWFLTNHLLIENETLGSYTCVWLTQAQQSQRRVRIDTSLFECFFISVLIGNISCESCSPPCF